MSTADTIALPEDLERDILAVLGLDRLPPPRSPATATHSPRQPARPSRHMVAPTAPTRSIIGQVIALARSRTASAPLAGASVLALVAGAVFLIDRAPDLPRSGPFEAPVPNAASALPTPIGSASAPPVIARNEAIGDAAPRSSPVTAGSAPARRPRLGVSGAPTFSAAVTPRPSSGRSQASNAPRRQAGQPGSAQRDELATRLVGPDAVTPTASPPSSAPERPEAPSDVAAEVPANTAPAPVSARAEQLASSRPVPSASPAPRDASRRSRLDGLDSLRTLRRQW